MEQACCSCTQQWRLLQPGLERGDEPAAEEADRTEWKEERALLCRECSAEITCASHRIEVDGAHQHAFFNPYGLLFEIGCFAAAPGAVTAGELTDEFSWFPGFAWQHALCSNCGSHLGWRYVSGSASFFGLVLNRLRE